MRKRVTSIMDRWEMTFLVFFRNHAELGPTHYDPTESTKRRFARAIANLHAAGKLRIKQDPDGNPVYIYEVLR